MIIEGNKSSGKKFLTILADGKFHEEVPDGTEGAVVRDYEDSKGVKGTKTELAHDGVNGIISSVSFSKTAFGVNLLVELGDEIISTGTAGSFGEDIMKKIPALDLSKPVTFTPYAFTPKGEKNIKKGVSMVQDGKKIGSHYFDTEKKVSINGVPTPEGDTSGFDTDDWKIHFMTVRKFLVKEIEKLPIFTVVEEKIAEVKEEIVGF